MPTHQGPEKANDPDDAINEWPKLDHVQSSVWPQQRTMAQHYLLMSSTKLPTFDMHVSSEGRAV